MESFFIALKTILPLFVVMLTGFAFSRHKSVGETWGKRGTSLLSIFVNGFRLQVSQLQFY